MNNLQRKKEDGFLVLCSDGNGLCTCVQKNKKNCFVIELNDGSHNKEDRIERDRKLLSY